MLLIMVWIIGWMFSLGYARGMTPEEKKEYSKGVRIFSNGLLIILSFFTWPFLLGSNLRTDYKMFITSKIMTK